MRVLIPFVLISIGTMQDIEVLKADGSTGIYLLKVNLRQAEQMRRAREEAHAECAEETSASRAPI
jgi:hypothetical protein